MRSRLAAHLNQPIDIASLVAFRILWGAVLCLGTLRFMLNGWVEILYAQPRMFFKYSGFEWVQAWPVWGMYLHYSLLCLLALCVALGLFYRVSIVLFTVGFAYAQLIDQTNYLNHYYLVVWLGLLMSCLPLGSYGSFDVWRRSAPKRTQIPAWMLYLLRFQIAVVYVNAGLAKFNSDWLLHAQPLHIWLGARTEIPLIGPLLAQGWVAYAFSWVGFIYDCSIVLFLSWPRTRLWAYGIVLIFHGLTQVFFDIGLFPILMTTGALLFFSPSWPHQAKSWLQRRFGSTALTSSARSETTSSTQERSLQLRPWAYALLGVYALFQLLMPLRHHLYSGDVLWHEQGMRYAWKVMVREKNGSITYHVHSPSRQRSWQVSPMQYLTWRQANEMSGQPDMILQLAQHIAQDFRQRGIKDVEVRAEALVSLNGRPQALLIDPKTDLTQVHDGIKPASWILPKPHSMPLKALR